MDVGISKWKYEYEMEVKMRKGEVGKEMEMYPMEVFPRIHLHAIG